MPYGRRYSSYQAYLAGAAEEGSEVGAVVGALQPNGDMWRAVSIGVTTGAITFIVTRLLEQVLFGSRSRR